jgi:O-antigen/teichoic acid export membrane protein
VSAPATQSSPPFRTGVLKGLRRHAARGTVINAAFQVGSAGLTFLQRLIVATIITPAQFGLWGVVLSIVLTIVFLKNAGIGDKFVQQDEADQERAFQKAFTIDLALAGLCVVIAGVAVPLFAVAYGHRDVIAPGLVLSLAIVGNSLQAPVWIHYREMDFVRQRLLLMIDPAVSFAVTVGLALAGLGVWCLVVGAVAGAFASGITAIVVSPYRLRLVLDRTTVREYFGFSWPLVVANGSGVGIGQIAQLATTRVLGLAGNGGMNLGYSIAALSRGVDAIVSQTIYPVICSVRDRRELLFESFIKSNRLAMLWGMPFGFGAALFGGDLVHLVLGERWAFAIGALEAFGIVAALDQLGFNWTAYCRALDWTRPLAVLGVLSLVSFAVCTLPLLIVWGLDGFAVGWVLWGVIGLAGRTYYLRQLFSEFRMARHAARALAPSIPAVGAVLLSRLAIGPDRTIPLALAEVALYVTVTVAASVYFERALLTEILGYLRRAPADASESAPPRADGPPASPPPPAPDR